MINFKAVWNFIAGESFLAPAGVGVAIVSAILVLRYIVSGVEVAGFVFVACIAAGLVAGVFEKV